MENKFLQRLEKNVQIDFEALEGKSPEELIKFIKDNVKTKEQLSFFIKAVYLAVQQDYWEAFQLSNEDKRKDQQDPEKAYIDFEILEGRVRYIPSKEIYLFKPRERVKKMLDSVDQKGQSRLKEILETRLYRMIESIYRLENTPEKENNKKE